MVDIDLISVWGIEFDLVLVSGSKLTWILCAAPPKIDIRVLADRCVGYVLEDHSVTVN